jgi:hypothetical protein
MTETSILPGAAPSTDSGIDMVPPGTGADESEGGSNRRRLLILGAVAGLIVLAAAGYLLLHKSSPSTKVLTPPPTSTTVPQHASQPSGTKQSTPKGKANSGKPTSLPKVAKHASVRDPFVPLVIAPVATSGGASSTTTVTAPTGTTPVTQPTTGTTPVTQPTTGTTTTTPGNGGKTAGSPLWIQLMRTHGRRAIFKVGYAHHKFRRYSVQAPTATSERGTVFDKVFALIGIQNGQVTLQIGDATPFDLTRGIAHNVV